MARSEEAISRSLTVLRWQNRFAGTAVGSFIAFFAVVVAGMSPSVLPYAAVVGAASGLVLTNIYWKRSMGRLARSFLAIEAEHLEAQGIVNGQMVHVRFRLDDLAVLQFGRKSPWFAGSSPAIQALDRVVLVVRDKSGDGIALQLAGVIFDVEALSRFCAQVSFRTGQAKNASG